MPAFSRDEIEAAFQHYEKTARLAGDTKNWSIWADLFTPDANYWEHLFGRMNGREEIKAWITKTMTTYTGNEMPHFPSDWHVIDEENGRVSSTSRTGCVTRETAASTRPPTCRSCTTPATTSGRTRRTSTTSTTSRG